MAKKGVIVYEKKGVKAIFLTDENAIKKREYLTLEDLKNEEIIWLVSAKERLNILKKIGYTTDKHNFIIDAKTEEIILAQDGALSFIYTKSATSRTSCRLFGQGVYK